MTQHQQFMHRALALAEQARFHASPNPWVGCVIVKDGQIVGEGYTQPPGQAHAEVCALMQAKENARGAAAYVTLEPCSHVGRTPPCSQALIKAGIREVYVALQDPDPRVCGRGIHQLEQAGIKVVQEICAEEARRSLTPYLYQRQTGLPYTILKAAISLDGRTAAADCSSQWITPIDAREDAHLLRAASQAIVIGAGTALKDSPRLTVRHSAFTLLRQPLRVLLDAHGRVPAQGPLFDQQLAPTLIITTSQASNARLQEWESTGAEVAVVSASSGGVDLQEAWTLLGKRPILQVLVEGGSTLHTSLLGTALVNGLSIYIGPLLLGASGQSFYQHHIATLSQALQFSLQHVEKLGDSVRLDYRFRKL